MKISLNWLTDFVEITEKDPKVIMETLTERSAEIEEFIDLGEDFKNVVVGEILEISAHPNADKVRVTKVDVGDGIIRQIICGAQNIEVGQKVPVALPGAVLPGEFCIEKRPMRGVESEGMLCSGKELGIAEDAQGIYILDAKSPLGQPLAETLGLGGVVLDIDNTAITNRPDLFSQYGFARELVANGLAKWKQKEWDFTKLLKEIPTTPLPVAFDIESPELCPARGEIVLENLQVMESPEWIRKRLIECGIRPINNIVDVSNYVMLELGMPLHTFDLDKISGNKITMRESTTGDKVVTLDSVERTLPAGVIINEDNRNIFDLAGIMGGENSEISETTTRVLIHVPVYDPIRIRKAMLRLGHRTDAATIYEKRVPNASVMPGLLRTVQLLKQLVPSSRITSAIEFVEHLPDRERLIELSLTMINRTFGKALPPNMITDILRRLDFEIMNADNDALTIRVPRHRLSDIETPEDLVEEIVRIYGINSLEAIPPAMEMQSAKPSPQKKLISELTDTLVKFGAMEMVNFAFVGPELLKKSGWEMDETMIEIENPLSVDQGIMRQSLLPRLLENARENRKYKDSFDIFEIGKTFFKVSATEKKEYQELAMLCVGKNFTEANSVLIGISATLSLPIRLEKAGKLSPLAARGACVKLQNESIGEIIELKQKVRVAFGLPEKSTCLTLKLSPLAEFSRKNKIIFSAPRFPAIELDLSILAETESYVEDIIKGLKQLDPLIETAEIIDIFSGEELPQGKKSVTLHFAFRASDRTLSGAEGDILKEKILTSLNKKGYEYRF